VRIVVPEWERVLLYRDGRFEELLEPGRHHRLRWRRRRVRVVIRPRQLVVPAQEVLTADGLSVKISLTAVVRTAEPRRWHETVESPEDFIYTALQIALREAVARRTLEELLTARAALSDDMKEPVQVTAESVGVELESLAVRDVMVPSELRRAAADVATARAQGMASLERARSEVAAARALANAARLVSEQPGLLQLRTLQAIEAGGATVVLHTQNSAPVSAEGSDVQQRQ
jgi:regulator of protease activity HflC (stomatin/prohibitin superfamily)